MKILSYIKGLFWTVIVLSVLMLSCSGGSDDVVNDEDDSGDITPPAVISDLRMESVTTNSAVLKWTAPGDDGMTGVAYRYDFRASMDTITAANFDSAYQIDSVDAPLPGGMTQTFTVEDLSPGESYFFAIKTRDNLSNWSGMSNCLGITCLEDLEVTFADTTLERIVREAIGIDSGTIHVSDLQDLTDLTGSDAGIESLSGLEHCPSLHWLIFQNNNISDLTPLQNLTGLLCLNLIDNNVSDLSPIAGATTLNQLHLGGNPVSNISALMNMTNLMWLRLNDTQVSDFSPIYNLLHLEELDLGNNNLSDIGFASHFGSVKIFNLAVNSISDLSSLSSLTNIENLYLAFNQISDLGPIQTMTGLKTIDLRNNNISDIEPLVNNTGIGSGDIVNLANNPLSETSLNTHIPALEARGVTVYH